MKTSQLNNLLSDYGINIENIRVNDIITIQMNTNIDKIDDILYNFFRNTKEENHLKVIECIEKHPIILSKNPDIINSNINFLYNIDECFVLDEIVEYLSILSAKCKNFRESVKYIKEQYDFETFLENPLLSVIPKNLIIKVEEEFKKYDIPISTTCEVCLYGDNNLYANFDENVQKAKFAIENNITLNKRLYSHSLDRIKLYQNHRNYGEIKFNSATKLVYIKREKVRKLLREKKKVTKKLKRPYFVVEDEKNNNLKAIPIFSNGEAKYDGDIQINEGEYGKFRSYYGINVVEDDFEKVEFVTEFEDPNDIEIIKNRGYFYKQNLYLNDNYDKYSEKINCFINKKTN